MPARKDKHRHNELAARIIAELRSYGLPQKHVSTFLGWLQSEQIVDLGGQGYSIDTLQRHYPLALKVGAVPSKQMLLAAMNGLALGEFDFENVSPDTKLRVMSDALKWTLEKQHGVGQQVKVGAADGDTFPVDLLAEVLNHEELLQLERIMVKLHNARKPGEALIEG